MRRLFAVPSVLLLVSLLSAQTPNAVNPPPPQTARQALIEMFFGTAADHLEKHLPDVTRKTFKRMDSGDGHSYLSEFSVLATQAKASGSKFEIFETGPTLLTVEDSGTGDGTEVQGERVEITLERDDLIGDEDQIELALHIIRGGKEEALPVIPHFTFSLKTESDIWRLNEISVAVRLPLADPDFLKNIEDRQRSQNEQTTIWAIREVTTAEKGYQSTHGGFACTLAALATAGKPSANPGLLYDRQLASGEKGGYVFVISGCDASHYKIVAEPAAQDSGQRAFCSDEGGTIRASADGKATTCLANGEPVQQGNTSNAPPSD
jgi:hypothetical protein